MPIVFTSPCKSHPLVLIGQPVSVGVLVDVDTDRCLDIEKSGITHPKTAILFKTITIRKNVTTFQPIDRLESIPNATVVRINNSVIQINADSGRIMSVAKVTFYHRLFLIYPEKIVIPILEIKRLPTQFGWYGIPQSLDKFAFRYLVFIHGEHFVHLFMPQGIVVYYFTITGKCAFPIVPEQMLFSS